MRNSDVRVRGCGDSWTWTVFVLVCGVLSMITQPAAAQQNDFPGEIVGVGEMPPILSGPTGSRSGTSWPSISSKPRT